MTKDCVYKLVEILDAHSTRKSDVAKILCALYLEKYGIIYRTKDSGERESCENDDNRVLHRKEICGVNIGDIFILKVVDSDEKIRVGNTCIKRFVDIGLVVNLPPEVYFYIMYILKTNICALCKKHNKPNNKTTSLTLTYHEKCLKKSMIFRFHNIIYELEGINLSKKLLRFFFGYDFKYEKFCAPYTKSKIEYMRQVVKEYKYILKDSSIEKMNALRNNTFINRVRHNNYLPTNKQLNHIYRILRDYERMLYYDEQNTNENYLKYGYVYPYSVFKEKVFKEH